MTARMCRCGTRQALRVERAGLTGHLCAECRAKADAVAAEFKRQFQELLDLGINRVLANEVMIERVNARRTTEVVA